MVILTWVLSAISVLGVAGTVVAFIFFPTVAAPILAKVTQTLLACKTCLVVAALVITALASFWYGREGEYDKGHTAAIAEIASEDAAVLKSATEKRAVWQECKAHDGEWNQSTGECK
jgi:hypothetical protein